VGPQLTDVLGLRELVPKWADAVGILTAVSGRSQPELIEAATVALATASKRGGALERPLTDAIAALLATEPAAARDVVNVILERCGKGRAQAALGTRELSDGADVFGEQSYSVRASRIGRRLRKRRYDLLFVSAGGLRAIAVEVKLGSSLADGQLEDLLAVDAEGLGLGPEAQLAVVVLGPRELELSSLSRRHEHLLGPVRWSSLIDSLLTIEFGDPQAQRLWNELFGLYVRRGRFGSELGARPSPRLALEAVAVPLRDLVQELVGDTKTVVLEADAGGHVTRGRGRVARIEIVISQRRGPRRQRRLTVGLTAPKGGRRRATIGSPDARTPDMGFPAPARVDALQSLLKERITILLEPRRPP
jgi:predicted nucleic acid-binding Zn ribbon protein